MNIDTIKAIRVDGTATGQNLLSIFFETTDIETKLHLTRRLDKRYKKEILLDDLVFIKTEVEYVYPFLNKHDTEFAKTVDHENATEITVDKKILESQSPVKNKEDIALISTRKKRSFVSC